jgi:hypothetical protein
MKTVIASLFLTVTVITSPAFARNGSYDAARDRGQAVYPDHSRIGDHHFTDEERRIIDAITRNGWSAGK